MNTSKLHPQLWPRAHKIIEIVAQQSEPLPTELILRSMQEKGSSVADVTLRRDLSKLVELSILKRIGKGRAIRYTVSKIHRCTLPMDEGAYLEIPIDHRPCQEGFNFEIFDELAEIQIFDRQELDSFRRYKKVFQKNLESLPPSIIRKEFERLTIELSWKSSAIEGNTYDLLETEILLKEGLRAKGKTAEEANMILNHKQALDFIREHKSVFKQLSISVIEKLHSILVENLNISKNIRKRLVGITGTKYSPLDNEYQIKEALGKSCDLINSRHNCFERSFLTLALVSYIQPFEDGNKRTSRLLANALLIVDDSFPLSFRSIDVLEYKKAILLFYERNYIPALKRLFVEQVEFAHNNYFR